MDTERAVVQFYNLASQMMAAGRDIPGVHLGDAVLADLRPGSCADAHVVFRLLWEAALLVHGDRRLGAWLGACCCAGAVRALERGRDGVWSSACPGRDIGGRDGAGGGGSGGGCCATCRQPVSALQLSAPAWPCARPVASRQLAPTDAAHALPYPLTHSAAPP